MAWEVTMAFISDERRRSPTFRQLLGLTWFIVVCTIASCAYLYWGHG
jgi:hypothetical protein